MAKLQSAEPLAQPMTQEEEECGLLDEEKPFSQVKVVRRICGLREEVALITAALCGVIFGFALALLLPMLNAQPKGSSEGTQNDLIERMSRGILQHLQMYRKVSAANKYHY